MLTEIFSLLHHLALVFCYILKTIRSKLFCLKVKEQWYHQVNHVYLLPAINERSVKSIKQQLFK